jgi:hypothetical protein
MQQDARLRTRSRRRPPDFAASSETPGGYVGQAVLESLARDVESILCTGVRVMSRRDFTMVAWYEMPGKGIKERPVPQGTV